MLVNGTCKAIRREVVLLGEVYSQLPGLMGLTHEAFDKHYLGHDFTVQSCHLLRRPDMLFRFGKFALLIEIDEHAHRGYTEGDEIRHLDVIRRWCLETYGLAHMYVVRINPDGPKPMFRKVHSSNKEAVWKPTVSFGEKFESVCKHLVPVLLRKDKEMFKGALNGTKVVKWFY